MPDFSRYFIRNGDATTAGGSVVATGTHMPVYGAHVALEGDQVHCPACNSTGVIQCVAPLRRITGHANKQLSVEGDLCICNCPVAPRLIASQKQASIGFSAAELAATPAAIPWLLHAGHTPESIGLDHSIRFHAVDKRTGLPMGETPYKVTLGNGTVHQGVTGKDGMTEPLFCDCQQTATIEIPYHDDSHNDHTAHHDAHHCSC